MLWALLLASSPVLAAADVGPLGPLGEHLGEPAAAARTFHVDVGYASVAVTLDIAAVERPTIVPVRLQAFRRTNMAHPDAHAVGLAPVTVYICDDARCGLRTPVQVAIGGPAKSVDATLWPTGLALQFEHEGQQSSCCAGLGRASHMILTTARDPSGDGFTAVTRGSDVDVNGGLFLVHAPDALRARAGAGLLRSFSGLIVTDDEAAVLTPALAGSIVELARAGGVVSVPQRSASMLGVDAAEDDNNDDDDDLEHGTVPGSLPPVSIDKVVTRLDVPPGTRIVPLGAGHVVVRPEARSNVDGASPDGDADARLAGVLAARPDLLDWLPHASPSDSIPLRAAGAGLAARPHRGVAFAIALACVVAVALCVHRSRRSGWRKSLLASAAVAVAGLAALVVVERVSVPSELRMNVVAWVGPNASWEVGVDAVRPRGDRELTVRSPVMPLGLVILGEETLPARTPAYRRLPKDAGFAASARVGSSSALAMMWQRPLFEARTNSPGGHGLARPEGKAPVTVDPATGVITNHLAVPLKAVLVKRGSRVGLDVPPGAARLVDELATVNAWYQWPDELSTLERRLLHEVVEGCSARLSAAVAPHPNGLDASACAAALVVVDDTTIGIEVSP